MTEIRLMAVPDIERCVSFGIESFRPVFASFERLYGTALFNALRPDWEKTQSTYIREAVNADEKETWVSVDEAQQVTGFVVLTTNEASGLGEIELMAVDPERQGEGIGKALSSHGVDRLRSLGMTHAIVGTADDDSHAPARAVYASAGFAPTSLQPFHMTVEL